MRQKGFSLKEALAMQGMFVRTMRPLYDVGVGELGIICGMYLVRSGYALTIRFSTPGGKTRSATYTLDWWDYLEMVFECERAA